ncbi:MAG: ring-opening amidohydrolase [Candidatus Melainabacteria bacterium]|nr:ring-opening amidohydrolase [Candidatus Melainabacteria bacterium]
MEIKAFKILTRSPSDLSGLMDLVDAGKINPEEVICIIGKTEGNGGRNDFTRDLSMLAFEDYFSSMLRISRKEVTDRIIFSLSGGCEGVVSPHIVVYSRSGSSSNIPSPEKRLALGIGFTREFKPEEIGRMAQVEETARVIKEVVAQLQIDSPKDVHLIQMKGAIPNYSFEEGEAARKSGKPMRSDMVYSRGASALGAAVALGEVESKSISDDSICSDFEKYSSTASCSAKPGLLRTEIMVLGNSSYWGGDLKINSSILHDMLDIESVQTTLEGLGFKLVNGHLNPEDSSRLIGVYAKSEADPRGTVRGKRHTMLQDDDISDTRYSRCVLSSVLACITGDTAVYVSTRSEHHGPQGGGTLSIVAQI